jgi:hypothetical protein
LTLINHGSATDLSMESASTTYPWFCDEIYTFPVSRFFTG